MIKLIFNWIITLCRIILGIAIFQAGLNYTRASGPFAFRQPDDAITGIFVMIIGAYIVFSCSIQSLFGDKCDK